MNNLDTINLSETASTPKIQQRCCNTTILKASLVIFGLLLIGGAIASHLCQVNAIAVYTMGSTGGFLILAVAIAGAAQCLRGCFESREIEDLDDKARLLGLDVTKLPENLSERRKFVENKGQEFLQKCDRLSIEALDMQINGLRNAVEKLKKIINDPNEPLEVTAMLGALHGPFNGSQQEKIDRLWSDLKLIIGPGSSNLKQNQIAQQKQKEISDLKNELLKLRQTSYRAYIQSIGKEVLLKEAQKYYLNSLPNVERQLMEDKVAKMTLTEILPELKAKVQGPSTDSYRTIEMQEIILEIERIL